MAGENIVGRVVALAEEVDGTPRLTRSALMRILSECYAVGMQPISSDERAQLVSRIGEVRKREGANRAFAVKSVEHPHVLVVRVVFSKKSERCNASRYANCLKFLCDAGVNAGDFAAEVSKRGGLTGIYWQARGREGKSLRRNKLTLSTTITVVAGQAFTLELMPNANGIFDVISRSNYGVAA